MFQIVSEKAVSRKHGDAPAGRHIARESNGQMIGFFRLIAESFYCKPLK
jgi:hypothetical protein